jgi:nicotinamide-nucleotide amidase
LYPHLRAVDVRLTATASSRRLARRAIAQVAIPLQWALGSAVYATGEASLEEVVGTLLVRQRKTIGIAESCTGGLVTDRLTDIPGSSRYVRGAIIAYHNTLKHRHLDVPEDVLRRRGAVSAQTAAAMARGVRAFAGADLGVSITGIAGPSGGSIPKPVGLVYLGLSDTRGTWTRRCRFFGDREAIKMQAAQTALDWLRGHLLASSRRTGA